MDRKEKSLYVSLLVTNVKFSCTIIFSEEKKKKQQLVSSVEQKKEAMLERTLQQKLLEQL